MTSPIRVFLADDHAMVRAGLRMVFGATPDVVVVGEAGDGWSVVRELAREDLGVDVLVLDLSLPRLNGIEVLERVLQARPGLAVLALSMYPEEHFARTLVASGAAGYLSKSGSEADLVDAVRTVAAGRVFLSRAAALARSDRPHHRLTARELQVFLLLVTGRSVTDIAAELDLGQSTVSTHVARIRGKLDVAGVAEMVSYAHREGLID